MPDQSNDISVKPIEKRRRKAWSRAQREEIIRRTAGRCYSCGLNMVPSDDWWVEHIIPHSLGGSDQPDNLLPSCRLCNFVRSNHSPEYVRRMLALGSALLREVDRNSQLGVAINEFIRLREARLAKKRKWPDLAMNSSAKNTIRQEREQLEQDSLAPKLNLGTHLSE